MELTLSSMQKKFSLKLPNESGRMHRVQGWM
jgi:hypothetical protein